MGKGAATNQNRVYSITKMRNLFLNNKWHQIFAILQAVFLYSKQSGKGQNLVILIRKKTSLNLLGKAQYVSKIPTRLLLYIKEPSWEGPLGTT